MSSITRMCTGKKAYPDKLSALKQSKTSRFLSRQLNIKPYKCLLGDHWHIGHQRSKR